MYCATKQVVLESEKLELLTSCDRLCSTKQHAVHLAICGKDAEQQELTLTPEKAILDNRSDLLLQGCHVCSAAPYTYQV